MPELAIVIVSYNARADLERCLDSLAAAPPAVPHEIVVVDNASDDASADAVRARRPAVRVIETGANLGFARATNAGIRCTDAGLILMLNADTVVPPGAIDALVGELVDRPEAAVAGPRVVAPDGVPELSFGPMITPMTALCRKVLQGLLERRVRPAVAWVDRRSRREQWPDWVTGACLLVRRTEAERAGLLDERYFMYFEDVDFCAAIRRLGGRVFFTPRAEVVHARGGSAAAAKDATALAYRRSQVAFYEKHHPRLVPALRAWLRWRRRLPSEHRPDLPGGGPRGV